jgi:hypothetical protein
VCKSSCAQALASSHMTFLSSSCSCFPYSLLLPSSDPGVVDFGPSGDVQNQWKEGKYNDLKSVPVEEREEMYQELRQLLDRREILRYIDFSQKCVIVCC